MYKLKWLYKFIIILLTKVLSFRFVWYFNFYLLGVCLQVLLHSSHLVMELSIFDVFRSIVVKLTDAFWCISKRLIFVEETWGRRWSFGWLLQTLTCITCSLKQRNWFFIWDNYLYLSLISLCFAVNCLNPYILLWNFLTTF